MKLRVLNIAPRIPQELGFLETLSRNLWWCWDSDAIDLFRRIDPDLWRNSGRNPLRFLGDVPQERLQHMVTDDGFLQHLQRVRQKFEAMIGSAVKMPVGKTGRRHCIAYFSLEFGIHESIRDYAGGLGVLAGDHLKAASDLNLPLVAVGLLYRQGYFQQFLSADGSQQEHYPENEISQMPLQPACDASGQQVFITIPLPDGQLKAAVWRLDVGRVALFFLDANIPENPAPYRAITFQLYDSDRRIRLRQELLLGVGGVRALLALGYEPCVSHINEGHAAFLTIARLSLLAKTDGHDLKTALEIVPRTSVFTTHTPVPAGNEVFDTDLVRPHLEALEREYGIPAAEVLAWGRAPDAPESHGFSMTILGLRMAHHCNGVSELHGKVARHMWQYLWPGRPQDEVPIQHVTNGIHVASWLSPDNLAVFDRYLGREWREHPGAAKLLHQIDQIPDDELWRAHELGRSRLVRIVRSHVERHLRSKQAPRADVAQARTLLDHKALTIGFARRFATYKRAALLFQDPERIEAMLTSRDRPVQLIFAGKAHPADEFGKDLIRKIVQFSRKAGVRNRIIFLEDYDIYIGRSLIQGADVWLNTPRRPQEASGTSGMKSAVNGGLNVSILDGWWCEGYAPECGWAIGHGEEYDDHAFQDLVEAQALYNVLEEEVVPRFFERTDGDIPLGWVRMMKESMKMALGRFTSHRMVAEYNARYYSPAMEVYEAQTADGAQAAHALVKQHERLRALWSKVGVDTVGPDRDAKLLHVGDSLRVEAVAHLGDLSPDEVEVQVYFGPLDSQNSITESHVQPLERAEVRGGGTFLYRGSVECRKSGRYGFTTRVVPHSADWKHDIPGFITWADGA